MITQVSRPLHRRLERFGAGELGRVTTAELVTGRLQLAVEHIQVTTATLTEVVADLVALGQAADQHTGVLGQVQPVGTGGTHDLQQPAGAVLDGVLALLHRRLKRGVARQDPELQEPHRLGRGAVALRVERPAAGEPHHLGRGPSR
jgi:hypothetical protein